MCPGRGNGIGKTSSKSQLEMVIENTKNNYTVKI